MLPAWRIEKMHLYRLPRGSVAGYGGVRAGRDCQLAIPLDDDFSFDTGQQNGVPRSESLQDSPELETSLCC